MNSTSFEAQLGGRWMNIGGLVLVFLGTSFFLKVAFDHNWIEPAFRVALGVAAGALLIAYARRLSAQGQTYFSEGITALGAGIEFLSLYSSNALFHLASPALVLLGMIAVNAALAAIAWRERSERLGFLTAFAGYVSPLLAGVNTGEPWMLASYITVLNAGLLLLSDILKSRFIAPLSLVGTLIYGTTYSWIQNLDDVQRAQIYGVLYAAYAAWGWARARLQESLQPMPVITSCVAFCAMLMGLETSLAPEHRVFLGTAMLLLGALHLAVAITRRSRVNGWFAVTAVMLGIPAAFTGVTINVAWAVEAAVVAVAAARYRDDVLRAAAIALLAVDAAWMGVHYTFYAATVPFWNERFIAAITLIGAMIVTRRAAFGDAGTETEIVVAQTLQIVTHVIGVAALSMEAWDGVLRFSTIQGSTAALSVVWAAYASALIAAGLRKHDATLRWEGLILMVVTAAKVFVADLSALDISYRVISAILVASH